MIVETFGLWFDQEIVDSRRPRFPKHLLSAPDGWDMCRAKLLSDVGSGNKALTLGQATIFDSVES